MLRIKMRRSGDVRLSVGWREKEASRLSLKDPLCRTVAVPRFRSVLPVGCTRLMDLMVLVGMSAHGG